MVGGDIWVGKKGRAEGQHYSLGCHSSNSGLSVVIYGWGGRGGRKREGGTEGQHYSLGCHGSNSGLFLQFHVYKQSLANSCGLLCDYDHVTY